MRIVTWNCNGAFRRKFEPIEALDADILVIQECEDPAQSSENYRSWAGRYLWKGYGKNKGIGIFLRKGRSLAPLDWPGDGYELFLPTRVDGEFDVLGVWTQGAAPPGYGYIGQFWNYLQVNKSRLGSGTLICGDFNSNRIWDKPNRQWNHSEGVRELEQLGLTSLYHLSTNELAGEESQPTFYLYRHLNRPFHIDYIFASAQHLPNGWKRMEVGRSADWLKLSDHMPIVVDL